MPVEPAPVSYWKEKRPGLPASVLVGRSRHAELRVTSFGIAGSPFLSPAPSAGRKQQTMDQASTTISFSSGLEPVENWSKMPVPLNVENTAETCGET